MKMLPATFAAALACAAAIALAAVSAADAAVPPAREMHGACPGAVSRVSLTDHPPVCCFGSPLCLRPLTAVIGHNPVARRT